MNWFKQKTNSEPRFDPPGPSPWYLRNREVETKVGTLTWTDYGNDRGLAGISRLQTKSGKDVLLLDFGCYVKPLHNDKILLWYETARNSSSPQTNQFIHFDIIDPNTLESIPDAKDAAQRMRNAKAHRTIYTQPLSEFTYFSTLEPGTHDLGKIPALFADLGEILVLADCNLNGKPSNNFDHMCRAIFAFSFSDNQVTVIPQDWFNNGAYDFGYQWITRVERDPNTRQIFGEGIRLGFFKLDKTSKMVEEWLNNDPFYRSN